MLIPGQGVAFVQRLDQEHEPIEAELREGLIRIQRTYDTAISFMYDRIIISGGISGGVGALWFGICAMSGPVGWAAAALYGGIGTAIFGSSVVGFFSYHDAAQARKNSLMELYKKEIDFVTQKYPELNQRILEHPEENLQLQPLSTHFDSVLRKPNEIKNECEKERLKDNAQRDAYNADQKRSRDSYVISRGMCLGADTEAQLRYPNRYW